MYQKYLLLFGFICSNVYLSAQVFQSSNLPIIILETNGQTIIDEPKIDVEMGIIYNGNGQRNKLSDPFNEYEGWAGIEIRGSSSQLLYDKKSFALETRDEMGENRNVALLGLPEENDWVLYGPYGDKSLIRNALAYKIAENLMDYAPRTRFVELMIDGDYRGIYMLTEKIKRDKNRVAISNLKPEDAEGDQLTGGYILKIDKYSGVFASGFASDYPPQPNAWQETFFQYHSPKPGDITDVQKAYIQNFISDFEKTLQGDNYSDSIIGYHQYIDASTFVDFFIVNELCRNVDAYRLSTFMYKDRDSIDNRLKMGPVWDFNLGFGNVDFCLGAGVAGWVKDYNATCPNDNWIIHFWWPRLWQDQNFRIAIRDRWLELRQGQLSNANLTACVDSLSGHLGEAQVRNFQRWPILSQYVWPNWFVGDTYPDEVDYLQTWLDGRLEWIDDQMTSIADVIYDNEDFFTPEVNPNPFSDQLFFKYYVRRTHTVACKVYNAQGQLVISLEDQDHPNGTNILEFNTQHLAPGIYFYKIWINEEEKANGKLMKIKGGN